MRLDLLPTTDRECHVCEDGRYIKNGSELICSDCQHTPTTERTAMTVSSAVETHRQQIESHSEDDSTERPKLHGGYADAYWGNGSYSFDMGEGKFIAQSH